MGSAHQTYMKCSETYRSLFLRYGDVLTRAQAESLADYHSLSLADLGYPESQIRFKTLDVVQSLGY